MKVFKFGGASIETVERALHVAQIIEQHQDEKLVVIVSAKGKTTNALEEIVRAYFNGDINLATTLFQALEKIIMTMHKNYWAMKHQQPSKN